MLAVSKTYKYFFAFSLLMIILAVAAVAVFGLRLGIEFKGGTLLELEFKQELALQQIQETLAMQGIDQASVRRTQNQNYLITTPTLEPDQVQELKNQLKTELGEFTEQRIESIGPTIGSELLQRAYWQVGLVTLIILLYVSYAFRKIKQSTKKVLSSWRLGFATLAALIHDLAITVGVFALLGYFFGVEIDTLFITALLTILGFSVHDTIVVFDRVRENLENHPNKKLATLVDFSIAQTLARSINTSSTLIFVLLAMLLFGGQSIFFFVVALLAGVVSGTYSSIFIASPLLLLKSRSKT